MLTIILAYDVLSTALVIACKAERKGRKISAHSPGRCDLNLEGCANSSLTRSGVMIFL